MDLSFDIEEIRDACETRSKALAMLGVAAGVGLHTRLADIEAAESVAELLVLHPSLVVDRSPHERAILFAEGHYLVFRSGHVKTPTTTAGATNWAKVTKIYLLAIEKVQ